MIKNESLKYLVTYITVPRERKWEDNCEWTANNGTCDVTHLTVGHLQYWLFVYIPNNKTKQEDISVHSLQIYTFKHFQWSSHINDIQMVNKHMLHSDHLFQMVH